jgi:hypothetical protein
MVTCGTQTRNHPGWASGDGRAVMCHWAQSGHVVARFDF